MKRPENGQKKRGRAVPGIEGLGMVGARGFRRLRAAAHEAFQAFGLALTAASLLVLPLPATDARDVVPSRLADQKKWLEPLTPQEKVLQLLNRTTFGPRPEEIGRVSQIGIEAYLDEQVHPERIDDSDADARLKALPTLSMDTAELMESFPPQRQQAAGPAGARRVNRQGSGDFTAGQRGPQRTMEGSAAAGAGSLGMMALDGPRRVIQELAQGEILRAVYSKRQLQEVMVQFWMNHFNVFAPKGADKLLMTSYERDTIRPHALSKFEDLLVATAESPAMLFYLDNWLSSAPDPNSAKNFAGRGKPAPLGGWRRPGTFGPFGGMGRRAPFGFPQRFPTNHTNRPNPRKGMPQPNRRGLNENYGRELMELHTLGVEGGYTQKDVTEVARCFTGWTIDRPRQGGGFIFNPRLHDYGEKVVLGHKIPKGHGMEDGLEVLRILAHHPSTAHFISQKLSQRFVSDDPPASLVDRASKTFLETGGDIRDTLKTILTSPEFYSQAAYRAKVKSPLELVASSLRALDAETDAGLPVVQWVARLGQPMFQYQAPTGFPDRASTWINSGTLLERINFAMMLATNRIPGTHVGFKGLVEQEDGTARDDLIARLSKRVMGEMPAAETRAVILKEAGEKALSPAGDDPRDASTIAGLVLASPDFQRR